MTARRVAAVTGAAGGIGAAVCARLASDHAGYLQGSVLMVDGGGTA